MNAFAKATLGVAIVATAALCWAWLAEPSSDETRSGRPTERGTNAEATKDAADGTGREIDTVRFREPEARADVETPSDPTTPMLRGRVIDVSGAGVAGVSLSVADRSGKPRGTPGFSSGEDGAFEFPAKAGGDIIVSTDPRWATALAGLTRVQEPNVSTVIVAPRIVLGGRVVDTGGNPLQAASVQVHLPSHFGADLGIPLDHSWGMGREATSDQDGRFVVHDVPAVAGAELSVALGGYLPRMVELPRESTESLELVLDRPGVGVAVVEGVVVDAFGALVAGARVSAGRRASLTDARGAFTIDVSSGKTFDRIVAIAKGMLPAIHSPERDVAGKPKWPERVILQLGQAPLSITGHVLDRDRRPVEGAKVWIDDPLVVAVGGKATLIAETFLGREDTPFWAFVVTDGAGKFRLDGLLDRAYVVKALDPSTLNAVTLKAVEAGSRDVELQMATAIHPELRGRVVGRDGAGISGISVNLERPALAVSIPGQAGASQFQWAQSTPAKTNEAGEFTLEDVPTDGVVVKALGDAIRPGRRSVKPGIDPMAFDLQVDRRMHLQVELAAPTDRADEFKVLNATGRNMLLVTMGTNRVVWKLKDGRSPVLSLGEGARTAVFFMDGEEVGRVSVQMQPGKVNKIRF